MNVGLLPQGGNDWIAGAIYLQNLVRAQAQLPAARRPSFYLIVGAGETVADYASLGDWVPPVRRYTFRRGCSLKAKIRSSIGRRGFRRPGSFEAVSERLGLAALFPAQCSLGPSFPRPWIGWVPDFQHRRLPQFFSDAERRNRDGLYGRMVAEASHVVVSSDDARRDLLECFPTEPARVTALRFVSVASTSWYEGSPEEVRRSHGLPEKYLMFPSQFWAHKNHRCLFEAIRLVRRRHPDICLVCTGRMHDYRWPRHADELEAFIRQHDLDRHVRLLGLLDRHTQIQLMRGAAALVQPSWFEGWSALIEDARTLGKRIYVSDIPVHREQVPPNATFFDPASPEQLAEIVIRDWPDLSPGPHRPSEQTAFLAHQPRAREFAEVFLGVVGAASSPC